jgi:NADP-dependent 3-hydroxy acid dehydrogenase YdfG
MGRLDGRVALVTGAGRGFGRAIALAFGREGADLAVSELPLRHLGEVEDVAYCAVFRAAEAAHYLTGQCSSPTAAG